MSRTRKVRDMRTFLACRDGATAIEYAMIASMISIAISAVVNQIGSSLVTNFYTALTNLF